MSLGSHSRRAALKTLGATGAMAAFGGMGEVLAQAKVTIGVISSRQCHLGVDHREVGVCSMSDSIYGSMEEVHVLRATP